MATIQAKRIKDAVKKVQQVGRIEDPVKIAGCDITFQNLSAPEFEAAMVDCEGFEDVAYAHAYEFAQISRSIVELNGEDLRDVDYIEDEVPVGHYVLECVVPSKSAADAVAATLREQKISVSATQVTDGSTKTVRFERHHWIRENALKGWGREALTVAWRKLTELGIRAEEAAKKGVTFLQPDESAEEKYRRLLNDLRETEEDLPDDMVNRILDDAGFLKKARREELDTVNTRLAQMRDAPAQPQEEAPEEVVVTPPVPLPRTASPSAPPPDAVQQAMLARTRMNEQGSDIPTPGVRQEPSHVSAAPRVRVPDQIRQAAMQNTEGVHGGHVVPSVVRGPQQADRQGDGISTRRQNRAAEIAALEAQFDPLEEGGAMSPHAAGEASQPPRGSLGIDSPPRGGVNTKYRPRGT